MINLAYEENGSGDPVLFIAGTGGAGRTWHIHQVPQFAAAGYRCITFDNRGIGATENAGGFGTEQMVADTAELIEQVVGGPTRVVAMSMGAYIAQELMLIRPDLVSQAVLMGTRGRLDRIRKSMRAAEVELSRSEIQLPPAYAAKVRVLENFSPKTINDEKAIGDWMEMFTAFPIKRTPGLAAQHEVYPKENRLAAYRAIRTEVLVIGFADDLLTPAALGREVADALPNGRYVQIGHTGHLGFLERPETVNTAMLDFFAGTLV
ncbi:alpha/beta hydrolase [Mycobacterium sp. CVI_P3]|uniref:Alpha/beta hydrolase n=1 Tax=Mycobacterium pinniadriaticum TaxID=2994102 RepID=A0ABT3SLR9_9MYCO|nr:alpha/beta hydrolase [Mycobacterium pinniadriaticum]MCX2933398.1 alpha/beta hydrolase [Mycobacterium pinniadriaticum]MCX2939820.1 alpha/beta hydrolase [Mycobacterium pinniadriaticum]